MPRRKLIHQSLTEHTVELLEEVKERIRRGPEKFVMTSWMDYQDRNLKNTSKFREIPLSIMLQDMEQLKMVEGACQTAACIAGHVICLRSENFERFAVATHPQAPYTPVSTFTEEGAKLLEISYEQAEKLFLVYMWPTKFIREIIKLTYTSFKEAKEDKECSTIAQLADYTPEMFDALKPEVRAEMAIRRIDYFIKTGS